MLKLSAIFAVIWASVGAALATTLTGSFSWVSGTITSSVTGSPNPQTINLKVGSNSFTYPNCYVAGKNTFSAGSPFTLLLKNSRPLAAVYSANSVLLMPNDASDVAGRIYVPMTSSGFISNTIAYPTQYAGQLTLHFPPCTVGALNFSAGMQVMVNTPIIGYSVTVPTPGSPTLGTATFAPSGIFPLYFNFMAIGNGNLNVGGSGNVSNLAIAATMYGAATKFTTGTLQIVSYTTA